MFDEIGLQMKTHNKWLKTIGISLLVATIGAAGLTGFMMTHDGGHSAEATERPNPYTNASIVKIMDGAADGAGPPHWCRGGHPASCSPAGLPRWCR